MSRPTAADRAAPAAMRIGEPLLARFKPRPQAGGRASLLEELDADILCGRCNEAWGVVARAEDGNHLVVLSNVFAERSSGYWELSRRAAYAWSQARREETAWATFCPGYRHRTRHYGRRPLKPEGSAKGPPEWVPVPTKRAQLQCEVRCPVCSRINHLAVAPTCEPGCPLHPHAMAAGPALASAADALFETFRASFGAADDAIAAPWKFAALAVLASMCGCQTESQFQRLLQRLPEHTLLQLVPRRPTLAQLEAATERFKGSEEDTVAAMQAALARLPENTLEMLKLWGSHVLK